MSSISSIDEALEYFGIKATSRVVHSGEVSLVLVDTKGWTLSMLGMAVAVRVNNEMFCLSGSDIYSAIAYAEQLSRRYNKWSKS